MCEAPKSAYISDQKGSPCSINAIRTGLIRTTTWMKLCGGFIIIMRTVKTDIREEAYGSFSTGSDFKRS